MGTQMYVLNMNRSQILLLPQGNDNNCFKIKLQIMLKKNMKSVKYIKNK